MTLDDLDESQAIRKIARFGSPAERLLLEDEAARGELFLVIDPLAGTDWLVHASSAPDALDRMAPDATLPARLEVHGVEAADYDVGLAYRLRQWAREPAAADPRLHILVDGLLEAGTDLALQHDAPTPLAFRPAALAIHRLLGASTPLAVLAAQLVSR